MLPRASRRWLGWCIAVVALTAVVIAWRYSNGHRPSEDPWDAPAMTFDGTSDALRETVIVPTLDSPLPEGKSAIWCASFQLAWNRLVDDVAKGPVLLAKGQAVADRLNRADQTENDLDRDSVVAAAGLVKDGIVERIRERMARQFPDVPSPRFDVPPGGAVAYAYLATSAKYDYPFFENDEPFLFTDSAGKRTPVGSFGIRKKDDYAYTRLRKQVRILYCPRESIWSEKEIPEFILDLCKSSRPHQIVLARVDRKATLAETLAYVKQRVAAQAAGGSSPSGLGPRDILLVPNMAWKVSHRFGELEGEDRRFSNPALRGLYLDTALQTIQFRLDRSGAELASEVKVLVKPGASLFRLDRPFLIIFQKRGAKHPFFVAWLENAELLEKR